MDSQFVAIGWAHERYRAGNARYSWSAELGPGVMFNQVNRPEVETAFGETMVLLYWKLHWSWVVGQTGFGAYAPPLRR